MAFKPPPSRKPKTDKPVKEKPAKPAKVKRAKKEAPSIKIKVIAAPPKAKKFVFYIGDEGVILVYTDQNKVLSRQFSSRRQRAESQKN